MNAPDFIRVGGVLYRARIPQSVEAALPNVQSNAKSALSALMRALHDANVGAEEIPKLTALDEAISGSNFPIAARTWASIQEGVLDVVRAMEKGPARNMLSRAALSLDDALTSLAQTATTAAAPITAGETLPSYITVGTDLYRLRK